MLEKILGTKITDALLKAFGLVFEKIFDGLDGNQLLLFSGLMIFVSIMIWVEIFFTNDKDMFHIIELILSNFCTAFFSRMKTPESKGNGDANKS